MSLSEKFIAHWQEKKFAQPDHTLLLAVSGGMDSMAMASLFLKNKIRFAVAHCNFGLRGEESDGDEALVRRFCAENNIIIHVASFDTAATASRDKKSIQETARDLRYTWFEALRSQHGYKAIVTAHHADDNAETMLINLMRGTGIAGLHGIPVQNGFVLRPLLFATRAEIATYTREEALEYRDDSSNAKDDYLRNYLRHHIVPQLENLMPGFTKRMKKTSDHIAEAEIVYNKAIQKELKGLLQKRGADFYIPINLLKNKKPLETICFELLKSFGFTHAQMPFFAQHFENWATGKFLASATHRIIRNRDFLIVTSLQKEETDFIIVDDVFHDVNTANGCFQFKVIRDQSVPPHANGNDSASIDIEKLERPLILRRWKDGDYFYPLGMGMKKKKVSRFFIDQKVPLHQKQNIWILESNKRIVWVAGFRLDERFKMTGNTKNLLQVRYSRNEADQNQLRK